MVRSADRDQAAGFFYWHDEQYPLDLSYDNVLRWFKLLDAQVGEVTKLLISFSMFVGDGLDVPIDKQAEEVRRIAQLIGESPYDFDADGTKTYDYEQDSEAIYASFIKEYGIDLVEEKGRLDYFKFRALFANLSAKSPIKELVQIRTENPAEHADDTKYVAAITQQQHEYALHKSDAEMEREKQAQLDKALESI